MDFCRIGFSSDHSNDVTDHVSNNSGICCITNTNASTQPSSSDNITALRLLSNNLASIFHYSTSDFDFFTDAKIVLPDGQEVSVHRCILSARSGFFKNMFMMMGSVVKFQLKEVAKEYDVGVDALKAVLGYLYSGKVKPLPKGVCVCVCAEDDCSHGGCRPALDFMVGALYASSIFQISELVAHYHV